MGFGLIGSMGLDVHYHSFFGIGLCYLQTAFPAMTKIVGTLGSKSRSVEIISDCLKAGMSGIVPLHLLPWLKLKCFSFVSSV